MNWKFNPQHIEYDPAYVRKRYRYVDDISGKLFWPNTMTAAGVGPPRSFRGNALTPPNGTHWRFSQSEIDRLQVEGRIYYSKSGMPYVKSFLEERKGRAVQNLWDDIVMSKSGAERLGYPTQKPLALLERVVAASSDEGDVVLDPFCGCGTTVHAAQKLNRRWIGIDITHLAISLIEKRLKDAFPGVKYNVHGVPKDADGAADLSRRDKYQFQWWAVSLVDAVPFAGKKKGADGGIDGLIYFKPDGKKTERAIVSVKGGDNVNVAMVRDLKGVLEREKAPIGLFISLVPPTKPMIAEAASAGFYDTGFGKFARLQILTVQDLFDGKKPHIPFGHSEGFKKAPREARENQDNLL